MNRQCKIGVEEANGAVISAVRRHLAAKATKLKSSRFFYSGSYMCNHLTSTALQCGRLQVETTEESAPSGYFWQVKLAGPT
jgi:hypothetical protein